MSESISGKWGYTRDEEFYTGAYDTPQDAIKASGAEEGETVIIGQYRAPVPPEEFIHAEDMIEHVLVQDEYSGEWADGCISYSEDQERELTEALRKVFATWLDRHDLRPKFGIVDEAGIRRITVGEPSDV